MCDCQGFNHAYAPSTPPPPRDVLDAEAAEWAAEFLTALRPPPRDPGIPSRAPRKSRKN